MLLRVRGRAAHHLRQVGERGEALGIERDTAERRFERVGLRQREAAAGDVLRGWFRESGDRPEFWFVNLIECHSPYLPPKPWNDLGPLSRIASARDARKYQTLEAVYPDGRREVLNKVNFHHRWHTVYTYEEWARPLLPRGTVLVTTSWYDNTVAQEGNPDPNQWVVFGQRSVDDMAHMWVGMTYLPLIGFASGEYPEIFRRVALFADKSSETRCWINCRGLLCGKSKRPFRFSDKHRLSSTPHARACCRCGDRMPPSAGVR